MIFVAVQFHEKSTLFLRNTCTWNNFEFDTSIQGQKEKNYVAFALFELAVFSNLPMITVSISALF